MNYEFKTNKKIKNPKLTERRFSENGSTFKSGLQFGNQKEKKKDKKMLCGGKILVKLMDYFLYFGWYR
jgi:hypothetical protein